MNRRLYCAEVLHVIVELIVNDFATSEIAVAAQETTGG
jgi:hypothetical protein